MLLIFSKQQLEEALESRRPWARKLDIKRKKQHEIDENKFLKRFRRELYAALKWDYEKAKKESFQAGFDYSARHDRPACPEGVEQAIDKHIAEVAMDGRERYVISAKSPGRWNSFDSSEIYWLLTHDEKAKPDVCS